MIKNLKKVISSAAAVAMLASSASAFALTFPDVDESASYANAVSTLTGLGIVNGDDNGKFNPDNSVTRAEFAKMVVEALGDGDAAAASTYTSFSDCQGHWAAGYIQTGVAKEFINGYDENTFGPDDTVTYAQAVKMLVGACGYDLWASNHGGWPSGYLSYGSSLKITNGVSMGNDVAVTRAQCAVLIYNALQAPLLAVNGYEYDNNGNLQPKYDQMDGTDKDWQTMLTEYHDAYVVKGRVIETSKSNEALDAGVVKFDVESSDRYKDETVKKDKPVTGEEMYAGETNAEDLLFTYSEAIVQVDSDSDDITIISITPYGTSKTYEFAADDVVTADEDSKNGKNPWEGQIAVKKSSTSSSTTKYDLETGDTKKAKIYVNGRVVATYGEAAFKKAVEDYIINNPTGTVTIVDATEAGSTSTNGKYDYIMVTYYIDDIVEDVVTTSSKARINTKESQATLTWDLDNEDVKIKFVLDGEEIEYTDLQEDDVLSIAFTPATATKVADAKGGVNVLVSRNTVSGTVSRVSDSTDNYAVVDGTEYEANGTTASVSDDWTGNDYTFYLNAFGKIAKAVEGDTSKNYGVVVGMYKTAGNDYYTVRIITADGEIKPYECKSPAEETAFINLAKSAGVSVATGESTLFSKNDVDKTKAMKMAVSYTLSGDKIKLDSAIYEAGKGDSGLIFKEATGKVGSYQIVDGTTKILDLSSYFGANSSVATLTVNDFADDEQYTLYPYAKNNNGDYRFMLVLDGTTSLKANAPFAVVKEKPGKSIVDDTNVYSIKVALLNSDKTEEEAIVSVDDSDTVAKNLKEGDVIVYNEGSKGYVEVGQVKLVMSGVSSYKTLFEKTIVTNAADFDGMIAAVGSDNKSTVADQTGAKKVTKYYFGPVTLKNGNNIEIGTEANVVNGKLVTNISKDVASFTMSSDTKVYTYDYNEIEKYRVSVGAVPTVSSSFFDKYLQDNTDNLIWRKVADSEGSKNPNFALIKEYDDDVTEVVVFLADDTDLKSVVTETTTAPTEAPATEAPTVSPEPAEGE